MIIYMASPIDRVPIEHTPELFSMRFKVRAALAQEPGMVLYDPSQAWIGTDPPHTAAIQQVNQEALQRADLVFAIFPAWSTSVGVPMEIQTAAKAGKVVIVYRDHLSYALLELSENRRVYLFDDLEKAIAAVRNFGHATTQPATYPIMQFASGAPTGLTRAYPDDAGFDLAYSGDQDLIVHPGEVANVPCGIRVQWPPNVWAMVVGRSSTFRNRGLLVNVSVIDPGYRGEMFFLVRNVEDLFKVIKPGDRLAQLIPLPALAPEMDDPVWGQVDAGTRGDNGFGSSGR